MLITIPMTSVLTKHVPRTTMVNIFKDLITKLTGEEKSFKDFIKATGKFKKQYKCLMVNVFFEDSTHFIECWLENDKGQDYAAVRPIKVTEPEELPRYMPDVSIILKHLTFNEKAAIHVSEDYKAICIFGV